MAVRSLALLFGPQVPVPAPPEISEALERVEIESAIGERGTFRLTFRVTDQAPADALLPESGQLTRISLVLDEGGRASVLTEGVAVVHTVASGPDGEMSLVVSGEDLTRLMDLAVHEQSFPGMPSNARVQVLLAKYIAFGVVPLVIPPLILSVPVPTDPIQHVTDYAYIRALAVAAGYRFTLDPGPAPGSSIAYWGPEPRPGPEPPFTIDFGRSVVETLQLSFDASALLVTPPQPARAVTGHGTLDVERAGVRLRPGARVDVRGAGNPIDGHFYVNRVRHTIMPDSHTQAFELLRTIPGV